MHFRHALEALQRAVETGEPQRLLEILAPDVVFLGDGGGIAQTAPTPVVGADTLARLLGRIAPTASLQLADVNGCPALVIRLDGKLDTVVAARIGDGRITELYAVRNPEKLTQVASERFLRR